MASTWSCKVNVLCSENESSVWEELLWRIRSLPDNSCSISVLNSRFSWLPPRLVVTSVYLEHNLKTTNSILADWFREDIAWYFSQPHISKESSKIKTQTPNYVIKDSCMILILFCTYASSHVTATSNHITRSYRVLR